MNDLIEAAKALSKPAEKMIDAVQCAIGKAYEPRHIRKMADAKAYEIKTVSDALAENSNIPICYEKGDIRMNTEDFEGLVKRTQNRLAYQELTKQRNIETVVDYAYDLLEEETEASNDPIDPDWLMRFFNSVEDLSNSEMQKIWAKILAGEIKKPKEYSLRTLEALRKISADEAALFQRICDYRIVIGKHSILPSDKQLLETFGIGFDDILKLDECGLINSSGTLALNVTIGPEITMLTNNGNLMIMAKSLSDSPRPMSIGQYAFTNTGIEIAKIFNNQISNEDLISFARYLQNEAKNLKIEAHRISSIDQEIFTYDTNDLLEQ